MLDNYSEYNRTKAKEAYLFISNKMKTKRTSHITGKEHSRHHLVLSHCQLPTKVSPIFSFIV